MRLFDSHCHLDHPRFDSDRAALLERARCAGVGELLLPAVSAASWPKIRELVVSDVGLYPAYGLHPYFIDQHRPEHLRQLADWLEREQPVAVGECGLDFFLPELDKSAQQRYFCDQLDLAVQFALPVVIHARKSVDQVLKAIRARPTLRGVCHSFSGSEQQAQQLIERGFKLGFGGPITYLRANKLRRLVTTLPLEALLLESDAPDQPGSEHGGERNEPAYLGEVLQVVAELRGVSEAEIAAATRWNARELFGL